MTCIWPLNHPVIQHFEFSTKILDWCAYHLWDLTALYIVYFLYFDQLVLECGFSRNVWCSLTDARDFCWQKYMQSCENTRITISHRTKRAKTEWCAFMAYFRWYSLNLKIRVDISSGKSVSKMILEGAKGVLCEIPCISHTDDSMSDHEAFSVENHHWH